MDQKDSTTHTRKLASATELRGKKSGMPKGKKGGKKMWISLISMVVVLGLAVGAYFLSGIIKPEEEILPEATKGPSETVKVVDRKQAEIEKVTLKRADGETYAILNQVTVTGTGDAAATSYTYEVEGKPGFKLDQSLAKDIVNYGANMTATRQIEENVSDFSVYGLDKPALSVTTSYTDGSEVTWLFGNQVPTGFGYYICQKGTQTVFTIYSSAFDTLNYKLNELYVLEMPVTFADYSVIQNVLVEQRGKDTVELRYLLETESTLSINSMVIAQPIFYEAHSDRAVEIMEACVALNITGYAGEKSELPEAGLEDPRAKIRVTDADGNVLNYTVGNFAGVDSVYVQIDDTDAVYLAAASTVSFLDNVSVSYLIDQFANLVNIQKVDGMIIEMDGEEYELGIEREDAADADGNPILNENTGKQEVIETFYFDGEETDEELFKDLYQVIIGAMFSKISDDWDIQGDVVASVTYVLNVEPGEFTVEYLEYDDDFYAVRRDNQTIFLIKKNMIEDIGTALSEYREGVYEGFEY